VLDIRRAIGDKAGMAVTQHNLNVLQSGAPVTIEHGKRHQVKSATEKYLAYGFGGMVMLGVIGLIGLWLWFQLPPAPTTQIPSQVVVLPPSTLTFTSTPSIFTPTYTNTYTEASTLTITPSFTSTYTLTPSFTASVTPSRTPTITAFVTLDTTGPPRPAIREPKSNIDVGCGNTQWMLKWSKPVDPSKIVRYNIYLNYSLDGTTYTNINLDNDSIINSESLNPSADVTKFVNQFCGKYHYFEWRVRAQDGAGNWGDWSLTAHFMALPVPG